MFNKWINKDAHLKIIRCKQKILTLCCLLYLKNRKEPSNSHKSFLLSTTICCFLCTFHIRGPSWKLSWNVKVSKCNFFCCCFKKCLFSFYRFLSCRSLQKIQELVVVTGWGVCGRESSRGPFSSSYITHKWGAQESVCEISTALGSCPNHPVYLRVLLDYGRKLGTWASLQGHKFSFPGDLACWSQQPIID